MIEGWTKKKISDGVGDGGFCSSFGGADDDGTPIFNRTNPSTLTNEMWLNSWGM